MVWQHYKVLNSAGRVIGKLVATGECDAYWAARANYGTKAHSVTPA